LLVQVVAADKNLVELGSAHRRNEFRCLSHKFSLNLAFGV
jgi:hypothetical protein